VKNAANMKNIIRVQRVTNTYVSTVLIQFILVLMLRARRSIIYNNAFFVVEFMELMLKLMFVINMQLYLLGYQEWITSFCKQGVRVNKEKYT
jgi:hypothetical protein